MAQIARLTLANFDSDYALTSRPAEVWPLLRELDRIVREQLPQILAEFALPVIDPNYRVYRVRQLRIELALNRQNLGNDVLPRLWAQKILQQLLYELRYGDPGNVARFPDHAHFAAAFVSDLLLGRAWQCWVYREFSPLRHLSRGEAIAELLSARPEFFPIVVAHLTRQNTLERLLDTLMERQAAQIVSAMEETSGTAPRAGGLLGLGRRVMGRLHACPLRQEAMALRQLHFLARIVPELGDDELPAAVVLSRHLALVQEGLLQPGGRLRLLEAIVPAGRVAGSGHESVSAELAGLIVQYRTQEQGGDYLQWLVGAAAALTPRAGIVPVPDEAIDAEAATEPDTADPAAETLAFFSAFAGFGLLLMTIKDLKLTERLSMAQLRAALIAMVEEGMRRRCERDPLWGVLFPVQDLRQPLPPWPELDEGLLEGLPAERRESIRELDAAEAWGALAAGHFALRLPGLGASSAGYLRRQFLQRSGRVRMTAKTLSLSLESMPLAIVLRMAGLHGWQGRLPWLERRELIIEIPAE